MLVYRTTTTPTLNLCRRCAGDYRSRPRPFLDALVAVDANEHCEKHDEDAEDSDRGDGVEEDDAGEEDGERLARRHDDREDDRAELRDRVEDEQLSGRRADRQEDDVEYEHGLARHERDRLEETALLDERETGEENGEEVDADHHLYGRHLVLVEQLALPVRREGVEREVHQEEYDARHGRYRAVVAHAVAGRQQEHAHPERYHDGRDVLVPLVRLLRHELPHQHDGDDLGRLRQDLGREADKLQRLVLAPAAHDVRE